MTGWAFAGSAASGLSEEWAGTCLIRIGEFGKKPRAGAALRARESEVQRALTSALVMFSPTRYAFWRLAGGIGLGEFRKRRAELLECRGLWREPDAHAAGAVREDNSPCRGGENVIALDSVGESLDEAGGIPSRAAPFGGAQRRLTCCCAANPSFAVRSA